VSCGDRCVCHEPSLQLSAAHRHESVVSSAMVHRTLDIMQAVTFYGTHTLPDTLMARRVNSSRAPNDDQTLIDEAV